MMCMSFMTRETVHIVLTIVALNALQVIAAGIIIASLIALNKEKLWTFLGLELGNDKGQTAIAISILSGLKSATAFKSHLADCMRCLDMSLTRLNPTYV